MRQQRFIISTPNSRARGKEHYGVFAPDQDEAFATVERHMGRTAAELGLRLERVE